MKNIAIFYHGFMYGPHYMNMMVEQFRKINNAIHTPDGGLEANLLAYCSKLHIGIVESQDKHPTYGKDWLLSFWANSSSKDTTTIINPKVEIRFHPENHEETDTLKWLRDYAQENPDTYVLYFHSKGITRYNACTEDWRRYMEYFVLENWKACVEKLDEGYDCCGVLWNTDTFMGQFPHFSGGMWWANTNYINRLNHAYLDMKIRYYREFWIGSGKSPKVFEFHNSRLNDKDELAKTGGHYYLPYPREKYAQ